MIFSSLSCSSQLRTTADMDLVLYEVGGNISESRRGEGLSPGPGAL